MNGKYHESEGRARPDRPPGHDEGGEGREPPPLTARNCWIVTDGKAGDETQCIGVAEALSLPHELHRVKPRAPWRWLMPRFGVIDPREAPGAPGSPLAPPFPDMVIASGRRAVSYLGHIKRASGGRTFTVFLKDPRAGNGIADFIWVPDHDRLRGDNVLVTATGPHRFSRQRIEAARKAPPAEIAAPPHPRVAVLVGGDSRHYRFNDIDTERFLKGLHRFEAEGARFMITGSRRTPAALHDAVSVLARDGGHLMWDGGAANPLLSYLANADAIVATADSANMVGEALVTGKPLHVFHPSGGHRKFEEFIAGLTRMGVVHPFPGPLKETTYEPIDATPRIAAAIRWRYLAHRNRIDAGAAAEG